MHLDARAAGPVDAWPHQNTARKMVGQPTARPPADSAWPHIASGAPHGPFPATGYARGRTWTWMREESRRSCGRVEEPSPPWRDATPSASPAPAPRDSQDLGCRDCSAQTPGLSRSSSSLQPSDEAKRLDLVVLLLAIDILVKIYSAPMHDLAHP